MSYIYEEIKRAREAREAAEAQTIDFTGSSMSAADIIAFRNNETKRYNNGSNGDYVYIPGGGICRTYERF